MDQVLICLRFPRLSTTFFLHHGFHFFSSSPNDFTSQPKSLVVQALNHFAMNVACMSKEGFPIYKNFNKIRMNTITPGYVFTPIFGGSPAEVEESPFMGGHLKDLGGWVNMDHLVDEYVDLLGDESANGKAVVCPSGDKSVYPKPFHEREMQLPLCYIPDGFKTPASYGKDKSIF